jgi:hypothetical protein
MTKQMTTTCAKLIVAPPVTLAILLMCAYDLPTK